MLRFDLKVLFVVCGLIAVIKADTAMEVKSFEISSLSNIQTSFNNFFKDLYGHHHRSQTTLRIARQNLFTASSEFPDYRLSDEARKNLNGLLSSLIYNIIDPVIDSVQKTAITKLYAFNTDQNTVTEQAFSPVKTQLFVLTSSTSNCTVQITSRKLTTEYSNFIGAINNCTRFVSQKLRNPINEFTRVHFEALPAINRVVRDLNSCTSSFTINRIETCVDKFLKTYCQDETCKINSIILAVKEQAESMSTEARTQYNKCLSGIDDKLPQNPSFLKEDGCNTTFLLD